MLVYRNPSVSAWAPLLACAYPVFETLFTICRRLWCRRHPGHPDSWHLHSLVKTAITARYLRMLPAPLRNACVSPVSWSIALVPAALAVNHAGTPDVLMQGVVASFALYLAVYGLVVAAWRARRRLPTHIATAPLAPATTATVKVVKPIATPIAPIVPMSAPVISPVIVSARVAKPSAANQATPLSDLGREQPARAFVRRRM
jgi:hypothetical protein